VTDLQTINGTVYNYSMAKGFKTGGRQAGTPNRRTQEVCDQLLALGCDPIEGMARLALDPANSPELRARMYSELAQYVAPKRKSVDLSSTTGGREVVFNIGIARQGSSQHLVDESKVDP
jgi:hypothetical protein